MENEKQLGEYDDVTGEGQADYPGVGKYVGHFLNGVPHGEGTLTYDTGSVYTGAWDNDTKHGHGKMTYADGGIYEGNWEKDEMNGHGKMTYADGGIYEGNWENDHKNGHGKMTYAGGDTYDGDWYDDKMHGNGKFTYFANKVVYEGELRSDKFSGYGTMTYPEGGRNIDYVGEWQNDEKHGTGIQRYRNGRVYNGLWNNGAEHPLFVNGVLADNEEYDPDSLPPFSPPIHEITLSYNTKGTDLVALEQKRISHELELKKPNSFFMQIHGAYYVTSIDDIIKHMNDKNNIKYACTRKCPGFEEEQQQSVEPLPAFSIDTDVNKTVPYLSINAIFGMQGLVPIFELWSAIQSGHNVYKFVPIEKVKFTASHHTAYNYGLWISGDHCQGGASQQVYTLERLVIKFDDVSKKNFMAANTIKIALRRHNALKTVKKLARRAKEYEISRREFHDWDVKDNAAHKIQRAARKYLSSRKPSHGGKRNKNLMRKTRRNRK
jgi:hypothetical protein